MVTRLCPTCTWSGCEQLTPTAMTLGEHIHSTIYYAVYSVLICSQPFLVHVMEWKSAGKAWYNLSISYIEYSTDELFIHAWYNKLSGYLYYGLHIHEWFTEDIALSVPFVCIAAVVQMSINHVP